MPIFEVPERPTAFQTLVMGLHAVLDTVLNAEKRDAPTLFFGNPFQGAEKKMPLVGWQHVGGHFVVGESLPTSPVDTTTPQPPALQQSNPNPVVEIGARRAMAAVTIYHWSPEQAEHVLDRMWLACKRGAADLQRFRWLLGRYEFPTESQGPRLINGASIIQVALPVDLPVPRDYDGEHPLVQVLGADLRAGQTDALTTDPELTEWQLNRWQ